MGASLLSLTLALPGFAAPPEGKGGGKGDGGDDGSGDPPAVIETTVPIAPDSAVSYVATKLEWEVEAETADPEYPGVWVHAVNSSGVAVGHVKRPPSARPDLQDPLGQGERRAVINVELDGEGYLVDHVMRDLNGLFSSSLSDLNLARPETELWRIAYAHDINAAGQILCRLIPNNQARTYRSTVESSNYGIEPVPDLFVIADLRDLSLIILDAGLGYDETDPNRNDEAINENGDVHLSAWSAEEGTTNELFTYDGGNYELSSDLIPSAFDSAFTLNSSRDFGFSARTPANGRSETVTLTRRINNVDEPLWSHTSKTYARFTPLGISEAGGSVYTTTVNFEEREIPYHVISATDRIRIADADCSGAVRTGGRPSLSRASIGGEEELVIRDYETNPTAAEYYVYKPNFAARHRVVFSDPLTGAVDVVLADGLNGGYLGDVMVSPPVDGPGYTDPYVEGQPYSGTYFGGYLAFTNCLPEENRHEAFLLKPVQ